MADYELKTNLKLDDILESSNVCKLLESDDVDYIGRCALDWYNEDKRSRADWEDRSAIAMKLALQVTERRTFPWPDCSNVKLPIITEAALQYQARAYPSLIDGNDLVKAKVYGEDPTGEKTARAERIGAHMSWQNMEQDEGWEEAHDKGLLVQAIAGVAFIKKVWDPGCRHNVTKLVLPKNFVINYYTRDLDTSPRYTEVYELADNDIRERELDGRFWNPDKEEEETERIGDYDEQLPKQANLDSGPLKQEQDERQGLTEPQVSSATPYQTGEQYCWWDLDGDGYQEPYIVTFDIGTGKVRRIVARFLPSGVQRIGAEVYKITPVRVYTKLPFIPSPDGGFYDIGLGQLLGSVNESANSAINQIFDAGTMATLGGGFVSRGFKNRGGPFTFRPFQFHPIDAPGDDIKKNVMLLPVREPSNVLFQVLGLLLQYAQRIVQATDIQLGENPGQNTPAETTRTLNENGSRVYSAIYKRTWRALGQEYDVQYDLNQHFLPESVDYFDLTRGQGAMIRRDDYMGSRLEVCPAADPHYVSETQRIQQATMLVQASNSLPGYNRYQCGLRLLKAMRVPAIEQVYQQPVGQDGKPVADFPPPPDPKMLEIQVKQGQLQLDAQKQQATALEMKIKLLALVQESGAKVQNLEAQAALYLAQGKSEQFEPVIKLLYAEIESEGARRSHLIDLVGVLTKASGEKDAGSGGTTGSGDAGLEKHASNAAILGTLASLNGGGQGQLGGGGIPVQ